MDFYQGGVFIMFYEVPWTGAPQTYIGELTETKHHMVRLYVGCNFELRYMDGRKARCSTETRLGWFVIVCDGIKSKGEAYTKNNMCNLYLNTLCF